MFRLCKQVLSVVVLASKKKRESACWATSMVMHVQAAHICRIVCAANLQHLKDLCANEWAFSICCHAGNYAGSLHFNVRIRFYLNGTTYDLHILDVPMYASYTGAYQFSLAVKLFDFLPQTGKTN